MNTLVTWHQYLQLLFDHYTRKERTPMQNLLEIVKQVAGKYPAKLTHEQCALIVNEVAWIASKTDPNWGISAKPNPKNARLPNGTLIAEDVLHHKAPTADSPHGTIVDILAGAPDRNEPVWIIQPYHGNPSGRPWLPPFDPLSFIAMPLPPLPPFQIAPDPVLEALAHLQDRITALAHDMNVTAHELLALRNEFKRGMVIRIQSRPFGESRGTVRSPEDDETRR